MMPPTTPPAIAPVLLLFELEPPDEVFEPSRVDCVISGLFSFASVCAAEGSNMPSCHVVAVGHDARVISKHILCL